MNIEHILQAHGLTGKRSKDKKPPSPITDFEALQGNNKVTLKWKNPVADTDFVGVRIQRKIGEYPQSHTDGITVFNGVATDYTDTEVANGVTYYYRAFTYDYDNNFNSDITQQGNTTPKEAAIYGVDIDETDSNPETSVTYTEMSVDLTPAANPSVGNFSYGSWENRFPFNDIKPFAISHDLTEYIELDPNDFTKTINGDTITISDSGDYNVMIRFPKVYWKIDKVGNTVSIKMSDFKVDETYRAWAHEYGTEEYNYIYISAYNVGSKAIDNVNYGKSQTGTSGFSDTLANIRELVRANNTTGTDIFEITNFYQYQMLQVMYTIMFKNLNSQNVFAKGNTNSTTVMTRGVAAHLGMYYGSTSVETMYMKLFGIENLWGNQTKWIEGIRTTSNLTIELKNYNYSDSNDWRDVGGTPPAAARHITKISGGELGFVGSSTIQGSSTTFYCDRQNYTNSRYATFGGDRTASTVSGMYNIEITNTVGNNFTALFTHYKNQ